MSLFYVGDSHLGAVVKAYHQREQQGRAARVPPFVWLSQFTPNLDPATGRINPALLDAVSAAAADHPFMVLSIAGNHHNIIGLLNHPRRFDFVVPSAPDLPLLTDHEVVPTALIEGALKQLLGPPLALLSALVRAVPCRAVHLQSPPPNPSAEHITRNPDEVFREHVERLGVAPASVRYKLWLLHSLLYRRACDEVGIPLVPPPAEAVDPAGFLAERAWAGDATHANEWYGDLVISQVELSPAR